MALEELRQLAVSENGLLDESLRKRSWPILLNAKALEQEETKTQISKNLRFCQDWKVYVKDFSDKHQVEVDVNRSLYAFDKCSGWTADKR